MDGSQLVIELVGNRLVHYKYFRIGEKRPPVRLSGKNFVEELLEKNAAVLQQAPASNLEKRNASPGNKRGSR